MDQPRHRVLIIEDEALLLQSMRAALSTLAEVEVTGVQLIAAALTTLEVELPDLLITDLSLPDGKVLKQPGNLFFLIETALYGTNDDLTVKGVKPDVNCDGKVGFGEGLPDANIFKAAVDEMDSQANDLNKDAGEIVITPSDAFTAITVMTPTMSEYFEQWKLSAFVAGAGKQSEQGFVATSRLSDIADILTGLDFTYEEIEPLIAEKNPDQAEQTASELSKLLSTAEDLRDREAAGEKFTPRQADQLGAEMQARAERIAGQVTQAAKDLDVEVTEGEINGRIANIAIQQGRRPEKLRQEMRRSGEIEALFILIREEKTLDKILDSAQIVDIVPSKSNESDEQG